MKTVQIILILLAIGITSDALELRGEYRVISASERRDFFKTLQTTAPTADENRTSLSELSVFRNEYITLGVGIGTQPRNFILALETGSSDLWLFDETYRFQTRGRPLYKANESSSSHRAFEYFNSRRAEGIRIVGQRYYDVVRPNPLPHFNQSLGSARWFYDQRGYPLPLSLPLDGILGLAPDMNTSTKGTPDSNPINNILRTLNTSIYGFWFGPYVPPGGVSAQFTLSLGRKNHVNCAIDQPGHAAQLYPLKKDVAVFLYAVHAPGFYHATGAFATLDSGFSVIRMPAYVFRAIFKHVLYTYDVLTHLYLVDCSLVKGPGFLAFDIQNHRHTIYADDYVLDVGLGNGKCSLAIAPSDDSTDRTEWTLGTPFLRSVCQHYDLDKSSVTFYQPRNRPSRPGGVLPTKECVQK